MLKFFDRFINDWARAIYVLFILVIVVAGGLAMQEVFAQRRGTVIELPGGVITFRAASGSLTAGESAAAVTGLEGVNFCSILLDVTTLTTADGDDEVDFYFQTSYDGGTTWSDMENIHYANADTGTTPTTVHRFGLLDVLAADVGATSTDGTLGDDSKLKMSIGDRVRIKTTVTGATAPTYAYSAIGVCR